MAEPGYGEQELDEVRGDEPQERLTTPPAHSSEALSAQGMALIGRMSNAGETHERISHLRSEIDAIVAETHAVVDPGRERIRSDYSANDKADDLKLRALQARMQAARAALADLPPTASASPEIRQELKALREHAAKQGAFVAKPHQLYMQHGMGGLLGQDQLRFASAAEKAAFVRRFEEEKRDKRQRQLREDEEDKRRQEDERRRRDEEDRRRRDRS